MAEAFAGSPEGPSRYDLLFLSSDEDKLWTEENLVKPLEKRGYTTCLPHRDFTPGMPKLNLLHDALKNSMRTVLVITPEFLEDWQFKQALDPTFIDEGKLIPFIYKRCNTLPEALTKVMPLEYNEQVDPCLLLDRIGNSIEHRKKSVDTPRRDRPRPVSEVLWDVVVYEHLPRSVETESNRRYSESGDWSVDAFFNDVDGYLQRLDRKEGRPFINIETDICENIIPEHLVKPALSHLSNYDKSRMVLSKLSCYQRSTKIVMVALIALNELILNDPIEGITANRIKDFEKILRAEVQPASLHAQATKEQRLRLTTYSNLLRCIILHLARGNLKTVFSQDDLSKLETIKRALEEDYEDDNPPRLDFALTCTIQALTCVTEPQEKFRKICQTVGDILKEVDCITRSQSASKPDCSSLSSKIDKAGIFDTGVAATYLLPKITSTHALLCLRTLLDHHIQKCTKGTFWKRQTKANKKQKGAEWILYHTAVMFVRVLKNKDCPKELRTLAANGDCSVVSSEQDGEGLLCLASFWSNQRLKNMPGYSKVQPLINKECRELVYCDIPDIANALSRRLLVKDNCLEVEKLVTEVQPKHIRSLHSTKGLEIERDPIHTCHNTVIYHGTMSGNHHVVVKVPQLQRLENLQCTEDIVSVDRIRNEILMLKHLRHENIMPISGYVLAIPPVHYITEFMHYGNLRQYLCNNRRSMWPAQHLLGIASDILQALIFLESRSIVHRNIRARKVLLGQSGNRMAIKLTGFELAREVEQNSSFYHFDMYRGTKNEELPLRWLAVESLAYCRYSVKSDIWMYAVLLYEIFTMGCVPWQEFAARSFDEVLQNIVHRNLRMKRPPCIPNAVFQVILECMNVEDRSRPSYSTLADKLGQLHDRYLESADVVYGEKLTAPPPIVQSNMADTSPIPTIAVPGRVFIPDPVPGVFESDPEDDGIYIDTLPAYSTEESVYNVYEDVDKQDMMLTSAVAAEDQPQPQKENQFMEVTRYNERKTRTLKDFRREMKNQNSTLRIVDLRQSIKEGSMTMVTEGTRMGTLEDWLIKTKEEDPTHYALHIAKALQAVHNKGFVHSDLRLGHVFLDASPHGTRDITIKLGRLSRVKKLQRGVYDMSLSESMFQDMDGCPTDSIRWSPAEVIQSGTYSFASDVYSLGVVFWQMYMAGQLLSSQGAHVRLIPHQLLKNEDVLLFLEGSHFLPKPPNCPDWMYTVMKKCWAYQLLERPAIQDVIEVLNHSDLGNALFSSWKQSCDPPDLSEIYDRPYEGASADSWLSDRSGIGRTASTRSNVDQLAHGTTTEMSRSMTDLQDQNPHQRAPLPLPRNISLRLPEPLPPRDYEGLLYPYEQSEARLSEDEYENPNQDPYEDPGPVIHQIDQEQSEARLSGDEYENPDDEEFYEVIHQIDQANSGQVAVLNSYYPKDNLKLSVGEVLTDLHHLGHGWWKGNSAEGRGQFVSAHVEFFVDGRDAYSHKEILEQGVQLNPNLKARVILDYTPDDELTIVAGEMVTVVDETTSDEDGWIRVMSSRGEGLVPKLCLASTIKDTTSSLAACNIDSDTDDMYDFADVPGEEGVYEEWSPPPSQAPSDQRFSINISMKKTEKNDNYRLMVSMADPGRLSVEYTKNGQLKKSRDQCLEADVAAHNMTEEQKDHYHPLAYGWMIKSMKKTIGARDITFLDWASSAANPMFPAAVEKGSIIYGPRVGNGEEDGRLVLVCMSPFYGKKCVRHEWYKDGDLVSEGVDLCMLYVTEPGEYRCHIISCGDDREMAMSEPVKVVQIYRVPEEYLIPPSALRLRVDPIGRGASATVFKASWKGTIVAAKELKGVRMNQIRNNEIEIMSKLHHPNIVSFFGVCFRESVIIVTEFVNGYDLSKAIADKKKFPPGSQGYIAYQLGQALDYMHQRKIVHQDVKPSNVLVDEKTYVTKLSDFGLGDFRRTRHSLTRETGLQGTIGYKHIESLESTQLQPASDVYAFGCVLYELFLGEEVWKGLMDWHIVSKIHKGEYPSYDHMSVPEEVHNVLSLCFTDADRRATMSELLPYVKKLVGRNYIVD
ncbi:uncharacterized protein LOC144882948 isoform X1 [Branchiostoma floridae x Branchiostoma japonicum]